MKRYQYLLIAAYLIILSLHIWGALSPSHENWGYHIFGFYDGIILYIFGGMILISILPVTRARILRILDILIKKISSLNILIIFIIVGGTFYGLIYLFPAKLHLLGDGAVLLRSVPLGITGEEITLSFRNQPLMFWIYRVAMSIHPTNASPDAYSVYLFIDLIAGFIYLVILFWVFGNVKLPPVEKVILASLIVFSAGTQFYFGYVENYILLYTVTIAYILTAWLSLERRISIIVPMLFYVLMVFLHMGMLIFLPSIFLLIILKWKHKKIYAFLLLGGIIIAGVVILYIMGFDIAFLTRHLGSGSVDFLMLFEGGRGNFPYPMFSWAHLIDWLNAHLLIAPFGLLLSLILIPAMPVERRWRNPVLVFMITAASCGLLFTWIINSALGMARDWDLLLSFFVPLMILPVYLLGQSITIPNRRDIIFVIVIFLLVRTAAWIGINSSEEKHLSRMKVLNSPYLLSKAAHMAYDEALANFFFDTGKYADARGYYEHYMTIDSMNPRIIGNIADVYRRIGEKEKYFYQLQRAVKVNSPDPGVYSNLGVEYASRGDTVKAIEYNLLAIKKNPKFQKAYANLGILYTAKRNFQEADKYFTIAINLGMRDQLLMRYAAEVCIMIEDYPRALQYYDTYLTLNPSDARSREIRNKIYQSLKAAAP